MIRFGLAKKLLGASPVYSVDEVERVFGVFFSPDQRRGLEIPFTEHVIRACAGTHILFPGFGLSLLEIREWHASLFRTKTGGWYAEGGKTFSRVSVPVRWHLLRMEPVPGSYYQTWEEQQSLLLPDEEVPSAAVVAFATMLHFKAAGVRLFERIFVRTSDVDADDFHVRVGIFDSDGIQVDYCWDDVRSSSVGLASSMLSRKF